MHIREFVAAIRLQLARAGYYGACEVFIPPMCTQLPIAIRVEPGIIDPEVLDNAIRTLWEKHESTQFQGWPPVPMVLDMDVEVLN